MTGIEKIILLDEEIQEFTDYTPLAEGAGLQDFQEEAAVVAKAVAELNERVPDPRARTLYMMRAFYFLGVLRGGEVYRETVRDVLEADVETLEPIEFKLSPSGAELFAWDLNHMAAKELARLYTSLGL